MDLYTNLTFMVQKGRGLGSRDPISKMGPLNNFWTNRAIRFKFGAACMSTIKRPPNWAWPGSRDPTSKFWEPI